MNGRVAPVTRDNFQDLFIVIEEKAAGSSRIGRKNGLEFGNIHSVGVSDKHCSNGHAKLTLSHHRECVALFCKIGEAKRSNCAA